MSNDKTPLFGSNAANRRSLSAELQDGSLFTVHLPARSLDHGTAAWDLDEVRNMFAEIADLDLETSHA